MLAGSDLALLPASVVRGVDGLTALDLELLCAGMPDIDVEDWCAHTRWCVRMGSGDGGELRGLLESEYVDLRAALFARLRAMSVEERARVLAFACGSGRLPAGGFQAMHPPFTVEVMPLQPTNFLPQAHTCFNMLCLPEYESAEVLAERLDAAVEQSGGGKGFGIV